MLLVDDLAAGGTKNLRHTPRGLVTLYQKSILNELYESQWSLSDKPGKYFSQMLQCADYNQVKRALASKTPKLGKIRPERCVFF